MTFLRKTSSAAAFAATAFAISAIPTQASLVISLQMGEMLDVGGAPVGANTLFQLVNLGPDGVFNAVNIGDGSGTGISQWVSGDDSVLDLATLGNDFPNVKAFDLQNGNNDVPGFLDRVFEFANDAFPKSTNIGIRWFPGLSPAAFDTLTLEVGQHYGQFTRSVPKYGQDPWRVEIGFGNLTFDPLATASFGGTDPIGPTDEARAFHQVIPEPATLALSMIGAAGLAFMRRRRA